MERSPHLILYALLFSFSMLLPVLSNESSNTVHFHVGVVLDATSLIGKTGNTSISIAMHDFYSQHRNYTTRLVLHSRDSGNETIGAVSAALDLMENEHVQAIIGPQRSAQGLFVSNLGNASKVPVISFSATSPALTSSDIPYFIRVASNDSVQVNAISSIVKAFGWREVVLIYEDTSFGIGIISYLIDALQNVDAEVPYRSVLSITSTEERIMGELYKLMTMQTRVFIVHMSPVLGSRLFLMAKELGMMGSGYVWIITDGLTSILDSKDSLPIGSMQGILGVRHYIQESKRLDDFKTRWKLQFRHRNQESGGTRASIYGVWAYDTVWLLAEAVEHIASFIKPQQPKSTSNSSVSLENLPISDVGPRLLKAILETKLNAISGEFVIKNNQLQASTFEIVNINGTGKAIGYWTPKYGINRTLFLDGAKKKYSTSRFDLDSVLWPGRSASVPKGWIMPTNQKKLKIGVPVKDSFFEFVKTERDPLTNATKFTGYTIDVFEAVLKVLPYAVSYEFVAFENSTGQMAGTYEDLVNQVYEQIYDAVVGDVTITENRSKYVDFTLPFLESGVAMIVPNPKDANKDPWIFIKPLTKDLWFGILAFFIYTSFVLCIIEPESNNDFTGTTSERIGAISYFIFSTMVFAHRDGVKGNFSRMVVIVWVFVVLVLVSSYTANLTSLLTVVKTQPLVKDVSQLLKNENYVGYKKGSFLEKYLRPIFPDESKMRALGGPREYIEALTEGHPNRSVAVVFHEVPYIKVFLSRYCNDHYVMINVNRTAGFGFVFPKGSPLIADISKAILNLIEGDEIVKIEKKWFGNSCHKQANDISSQILNFKSFWTLYVITGVTSLLSLLISIAFFIYNERSILRTISGDDSIWQTSKSWAKYYYKGETKIVEENSTHRGKSSSPHKDNYEGSENEFSTSSNGNSTPTNEASSSIHHGSPHCFGQPTENSTVKPR